MTVPTDQYPPPPAFLSRHCPPLVDPLPSKCNCGGGPHFCDVKYRVREFLQEERRKAMMPGRNSTGCEGMRRASNNKQRKRCYRLLAIHHYHFTFRHPLPHCVVAVSGKASGSVALAYSSFQDAMAVASQWL